MAWYKVTLPKQDTGNALQAAFEALFLANRSPKDAALFRGHDPSSHTVSLYFSPAAAGIAKTLIASHKGVECPRPSPPATPTLQWAMLVGHDGAREALFPETSKKRTE